MAVAWSNNSSKSSTFNCYIVRDLTAPILESSQTSHLEEHFILGEQLGWGQFGVIRVCTDRITNDAFACKSIPKERLITPEDVRSIKLEIEIMSKLSGHPNVVDLKAVYEDGKYVHLVMELCAGGELFHWLEKNGRFPEPKARILFRHLMEVVMYCHDKGVIHRDLKPENILLATRSSSSPIKLADFGLATYIKPGQSLHGTVGSPFYIAPEVLAGGYHQAADVWSAGVILYILLSGMPPFWGKTKSKIFDAVRASDLQFPSEPWDFVSASAKDLIAGMLCRDPVRRLTAAQVLDHSWINSCTKQDQEPFGHENFSVFGRTDMSGCFFSAPLNHEFSFSSGSSACSAMQDISYTPFCCKSSFSSFLVDATPCTSQAGFSFHSSADSGSLKFASPIPSMPSFAFASAASPKDNSVTNPLQRDSSIGKLFILADTPPAAREGTEPGQKAVEIRRGTSASRASGIHGKRNRTIGLGEREQLDLMVSESIIRWASCHLPGAASLRSSLVC